MLGGPSNKQSARRPGRGGKSEAKAKTRPPQGFFPRREKVPAAVTPEKSPGLRYVAQGALKESFVLIMAAGESMQQQLVFHRPIGITAMGDDEWVCSLQQDIPLLLMRQDDPGAKARQERVSNELYSLAVASVRATGQNIHIRDGEVYINELHRPSLLKQAKALAKASNVVETPQGGPPPYFRFLNVTEQKVEMKFIFALRDPELIAQAEAKIAPTGYVTYGGAAADKPQEPVPYLKGLSKVQAFDAMSRRIHATIYGLPDGGEVDEEPDHDREEDDQDTHNDQKKLLTDVSRGLALTGKEVHADVLEEWATLSGTKKEQKVATPTESSPHLGSPKDPKEVTTKAPPDGGTVGEEKGLVNPSVPPPPGPQSKKIVDSAIENQSQRLDKRSKSSGGSNPSKKKATKTATNSLSP